MNSENSLDGTNLRKATSNIGSHLVKSKAPNPMGGQPPFYLHGNDKSFAQLMISPPKNQKHGTAISIKPHSKKITSELEFENLSVQ